MIAWIKNWLAERKHRRDAEAFMRGYEFGKRVLTDGTYTPEALEQLTYVLFDKASHHRRFDDGVHAAIADAERNP